MILNGQYTNAVIFSETVESSALDQIEKIVNQPFMKDVKVRIMPDVHAGAGICIGYTATLNEFVVPNFIGVDIGCGVLSQKLNVRKIDFGAFDKYVRKNIPHGMKNNDNAKMMEISKGVACTEADPLEFSERLKETACRVYDSRGENKALCQLGSLGGGNHFIAINQDEQGKYWVTIHSGSRNFGLTVANFHQKVAKSTEKEYLTGENAQKYFEDAKTAQVFAEINRFVMLDRLLAFFGKPKKVVDDQQVHTIHNYIDFKDGIIRKGAVAAPKDEYLVIPMSMRDGVLLCKGKGNKEWNFSAPHGAGRLMSRSMAKQSFTVHEFKRQMEEAGVWTSCIGQETLDESPMAYKSPDEIKSIIGDTVEIVDHWKEVYNFKASE